MKGREAEREAVRKLLDNASHERMEICHHADGAPYIAGRADIHVSVSHSKSSCLLAVSDAPVGVDIESPRPQLARVAHKFLTIGEKVRVDAAKNNALVDFLLHYWTAKEAAFKLFREPGLTVSGIEVSSDSGSASTESGLRCAISYVRCEGQLIAIASHEGGVEYSLDYVH